MLLWCIVADAVAQRRWRNTSCWQPTSSWSGFTTWDYRNGFWNTAPGINVPVVLNVNIAPRQPLSWMDQYYQSPYAGTYYQQPPQPRLVRSMVWDGWRWVWTYYYVY